MKAFTGVKTQIFRNRIETNSLGNLTICLAAITNNITEISTTEKHVLGLELKVVVSTLLEDGKR